MKIQHPCNLLLLCICMLSNAAGAQIPTSGLRLWLRADAGCYQNDSITPSANNTLLQSWLDQSGAGNHFWQTDTGKQPVYVTNVLCGKPVIRFDVSRRTFLQSDMLLGGQKTVFIVFIMPPMNNAARTMLSLKSPAASFTEIIATDFSGYRPLTVINDLPSTPGGGFYQPSVGVNTGFSATGNLVCVKFNGGAYSDPASYQINVDNSAAAVTGGGLLGRYDTDLTTIGARAPFQNINFLTGDIAEILVYDRLVSMPETDSVTSYLIGKYGIANNCLLPLDLSFFELKQAPGKISVEWKPVNETGLEKYFVQRSNDGVSWTAIGEIPVRMSIAVSNYSLMDDRPLKGWNYYRIASLRYDGKIDLSIVKRTFIDHGSVTCTLYPNPSSSYFILNTNKPEPVEMILRDCSGKLVKREQVINSRKISTSALDPGIYYVEVKSSSTTEMLKLIIQ